MTWKIICSIIISTVLLTNLTIGADGATKLAGQAKPLKRNLHVRSHEAVKKSLVKDTGGGQTQNEGQERSQQESNPDFGEGRQDLSIFNGTFGNLTGTLGSLGSTALLGLAGTPVLKGIAKASLLALPFQIKELLLRPLILVALFLFLITGAAFFVCNVVNCQNLIGGLGGIGDIGGGYGGSTKYGHRNDEDFQLLYDKTLRPILKAVENGYQKYK